MYCFYIDYKAVRDIYFKSKSKVIVLLILNFITLYYRWVV